MNEQRIKELAEDVLKDVFPQERRLKLLFAGNKYSFGTNKLLDKFGSTTTTTTLRIPILGTSTNLVANLLSIRIENELRTFLFDQLSTFNKHYFVSYPGVTIEPHIEDNEVVMNISYTTLN